jgi:hypothetical protein
MLGGEKTTFALAAEMLGGKKNYVRYFWWMWDELAECEGERKRVSVLPFHSALSDYLLIANLSRVLFSVIICFVFTRVHCTNICCCL